MTAARIRIHDAMLDCLRDSSGKGRADPFRYGDVAGGVEQAIKGERPAMADAERHDLTAAVLALWNDMLRNGMISFGTPLTGWSLDLFHLTDAGREVLKYRDHAPSNPDGYMEYLKRRATLDPVSESYVREALHTYQAGCHKATAVMVGTATEGMILDLRECLVARLGGRGKKVPKDLALAEWRIKIISDGIERELEAQKAHMPAELSGAFDIYWVGFAGRVRMIRNKTGHPNSIDPVNPEAVHAALLEFPDFARLVGNLKAWIAGHPF